jgi:hypothetical protein
MKYTPGQQAYYEKLKDPRWQKKRLEILERDEFTCQQCMDDKSTLNVHHRRYIKNRDPWDYPNDALITLCESCHEGEKETMAYELDSLNEQIQDKFLSADVEQLARGFNAFVPHHISSVMAVVIKWTLSNSEIMHELTDRYFKSLADQNRGTNGKAD